MSSIFRGSAYYHNAFQNLHINLLQAPGTISQTVLAQRTGFTFSAWGMLFVFFFTRKFFSKVVFSATKYPVN